MYFFRQLIACFRGVIHNSTGWLTRFLNIIQSDSASSNIVLVIWLTVWSNLDSFSEPLATAYTVGP